MQFWCPAQLEELTHPWVRGNHFLFTVPTCSFPSNLPESIFIFIFDWRLHHSYRVLRLLVLRAFPTPAEPSTVFNHTPFNAPKLSYTPLSPHRCKMILDASRSRHLPQLPRQHSLSPFPDHTEGKDTSTAATFPPASPPKFFATAIILGYKLYVLLVQAELSSSLIGSVPKNRATSGEVKRKASTFRDRLALNTWPRVFLSPGPQTPVVVASILITTVAPTSSPSPSSSQHF